MPRNTKGRGRSGKSDKPRDLQSVPQQEREGEEGFEGQPGPSTSRPQGEGRGRGRSGGDRGDGRGFGRTLSQKSESRGKHPRGEEMDQGEGHTTVGRGRAGGGGKREESVQPEKEKEKQTPSEGGDVGSMGGGGDEATSQGPSEEKRPRRGLELVPTRPRTCATKQGTTGNPIMLTTNYFDIDSIPNWILYQYQVTFDVDEPRDGVKRYWIAMHKNVEIKTAYIFDGGHLYTSKRLTDKTPDILRLVTETSDKKTVHIEIKYIQELRRGHAAYLQVFNVLLRRSLAGLKLHLVQRNYFDPIASVRIPQHRMELWPGYATHIREYDGGIMMCTRVSHKVMRTDTAFDVLKDCIKTPDYKRNFLQAILGAVVLTDYTNKTYQIADVDFDQNPLSTFAFKGGRITFADYYQEKYGVTITDLKQPLLATRKIDKASKNADESQKSTRECLLIPELCRMTGLTKIMMDNKTLMRDMSGVTRVPPNERVKRLEAFNQRLHSNDTVSTEFSEWGLKISRKLKTVKGRTLPNETIQVGNRRSFSVGRDYDWTVPLRTSPVFSSGCLNRWVFISSLKMKDVVDKFLPLLRKAAEGMRIPLPPPIIFNTRTEHSSEVVEAIEKAMATHNPELFVFGFSNERPDRYSAVKRKCCVDRGVASQVILLRSMTSKGAMSVATKIIIQIHAKLGGVPWNVPIPADKCMVVGFDVCHDTMSKSVGAMVASTSSNMSSWYSSVNQHNSREEISFYLAGNIYTALEKFRDKNNSLPARLIVYRDGVGEGQIAHVIEHEVNVLKEKLTKLYGGPNWRMAYVIVTKRINTRLFSEGKNPPPGTVVDDVITQPERYDFYLVSQSVRQGTVTPTLYNIISDNLGWSADIMQRFTYKLTHLYYNSSSPVQVPAPCQYAHKLAFLTNQALHGTPNVQLSDKLYFL